MVVVPVGSIRTGGGCWWWLCLCSRVDFEVEGKSSSLSGVIDSKLSSFISSILFRSSCSFLVAAASVACSSWS